MSEQAEWGVRWERPGGMHIDGELDEQTARRYARHAVQPGCSVTLIRRTVTCGEWEPIPSKVPDLSRVPLGILPALGGDEGPAFSSGI